MEIVYRIMEQGDRQRVILLMKQSKLRMKAVAGPLLYKALVKDFLHDDLAHCIVAVHDSKVVGYGFGFRNWGKYKSRFMVKHPLPAAQMILKRIWNIFRPKNEKVLPEDQRYIPEVVHPPEAFPYRWQDSDNLIAKSIHTAVDLDFRKHSIATNVFEHLYTELRNHGVWRFDGYIHKNNRRSIRMCEQMGWQFTDHGDDSYYLFKILIENSPHV